MGKRRIKKNDIVEVYWRDSTSLHGWRDEGDIDKNAHCALCRSVGYFYKETKGDFVMSRTLEVSSEDREETEIIPKGTIKRVRKL